MNLPSLFIDTEKLSSPITSLDTSLTGSIWYLALNNVIQLHSIATTHSRTVAQSIWRVLKMNLKKQLPQLLSIISVKLPNRFSKLLIHIDS
jgi:hypothetical protein